MFLAHIDGEEDFIRFSGLYTRCTVWAEEALQDGHDGYHRISQMNDRLINSQRALSRANSLIALLEQDELTSLLRIPALYNRTNQRMAEQPGADFDMIALNLHSIRTVNELFGREAGNRLLQDLALFLTGLEHTKQGLLAKYGLEAGQLRLEVLERAYVQDSARLFRVLTALRQQGFVIEMDDFGVGESSPAMLAEMPVDVIKLDRKFLLTAQQVPAHIEVIRCIIQLARKLGIGIIAEGVETPEQAQLLLSLGCCHAQGYLYGKPQSAENFLNPAAT